MPEDPAAVRRIEVRAAKMADAKALGGFFMRAWKEAGPGALGFTGATEGAIKEISSVQFLAERLASPNVKMLVAVSEGEVVGFASLRTEGHGATELSGIVVLQSASGAGIGSRLLRKSFALAARLGFRAMTVRTEALNKRAIGFYRKNGFTEAGKTTEKVGRTRVALSVLRKTLR
ncbi:MAG: GNAT family N-acetyltransferase [Nitrososphaerota archaeon]|nr:GNAT family N-acetyltransferase [Nitrososphaerota archaeon]MDG7024222.1 GNAT family N-acetyltransferase [Nitrososphaerota archaeon]